MTSEISKLNESPIYELINPRPYYEILKNGIGQQLSQASYTAQSIIEIRNFFKDRQIEFIEDDQMPYNRDVVMIICHSLLCVHFNTINSVNSKFSESFELRFSPYCEACVELIQDIDQSEDLMNVYNLLSAHISNLTIS